MGKWEDRAGDSSGYLITSSPFFNSESQEVAGEKKKSRGKTEVSQKGSLRLSKNS